MSKKVVFQKELNLRYDDDNVNIEINDDTSRAILKKKTLKSKYPKTNKTEFREIYEIPKIGKKLDLYPPLYFQYKPHFILKDEAQKINDYSKNYKTELSETGSVNRSSLNFSNEKEKKANNSFNSVDPEFAVNFIKPENGLVNINNEKDRKPYSSVNSVDIQRVINNDLKEEKRESKRKTITDFVTFFLSSHFSFSAKLSKFIKKLVMPHILSIAFTMIFIEIQNYYQSICFLDQCPCADVFVIKLYTTAKAILLFWNLIIIMGYITVFHVEYLRQFKLIRFLFVCIAYVSIIYFYFSMNCSDEEPKAIWFFILGAGAVSFLFIIYFVKINFNFKLLIKTTSNRANLMFLIFLNYLMNIHGYAYLRELILQMEMSKSNSTNIYQVLVGVIILIFRTLFKFAFYQHAKTEGISEKTKLNSIGYFIRICICIISATEVSNLFGLDLSFWGVWFILINHVVFLIVFYTRYNFLLILLNKIIKLIFHKDEFYKESESEQLMDKLLSGYMIDFQFILIPRIITLYFYRKWLTIHITQYYTNCKLEISDDKFKMNKDMVYLILAMNISITIFIAIWMYKHNKDFFIYIPEKIHIWKRAYIILMVHNYFEFVVQESRQPDF